MVLLRAFSTSVLVMLSLVACDVGEVPIGGGGGGTDGGNGSGSAGFATVCVDRSATPGQSHEHGGTAGLTHAGEGCVVAQCHGPAQPGGEFKAAGTVYKQDGVTPNPGVVIRIKSGNMVLQAVSESGGTFHFPATANITFPAITDASACPTGSLMRTNLTANSGPNCSQQGCHTPTGGQGPIRGVP